jgi:hypothetical protein
VNSNPDRENIMKPVITITIILLTTVAAAHALRLVFGVEMTVGATDIPMWVSVVGAVVPGALAVLLWRESRNLTP